MKKILYTVGMIISLVIGTILGTMFAPKANIVTTAVGDTQSTQKISQIVMNGGSTATTTVNSMWASLYNPDANARIIQDIYYEISNIETNAEINLLTSTSTGATTTVASSAIFVGPLATTSIIYTSTSSSGSMGTIPAIRVWPSGTYLNFSASSTKTSGTTTTLTGTGIIGVRYAAAAN